LFPPRANELPRARPRFTILNPNQPIIRRRHTDNGQLATVHYGLRYSTCTALYVQVLIIEYMYVHHSIPIAYTLYFVNILYCKRYTAVNTICTYSTRLQVWRSIEGARAQIFFDESFTAWCVSYRYLYEVPVYWYVRYRGLGVPRCTVYSCITASLHRRRRCSPLFSPSDHRQSGEGATLKLECSVCIFTKKQWRRTRSRDLCLGRRKLMRKNHG
jgi:hypothetical protein